MTKTEPVAKKDSAARLIDSIRGLEQSSIEAVRKFVDTANGMFPDVGDDGPRQKVIDAAFNMVEQIVGASSKLAQNIVSATEIALDEFDQNADKNASPSKV